MAAETVWLDAEGAEAVRAEVRRVVQAVVDLRGAIGWTEGVTAPELDAWFDQRVAAVAAGRERFGLVRDGGRVLALGRWGWHPDGPFRFNAEVRQVMTDPGARGAGHARRLVETLVADARAAGVESLLLSVRGNNHAAERMYVGLGFREVGVWRGMVAVGDERFDAVWHQLVLGRPPGTVVRGREPGGPGAS